MDTKLKRISYHWAAKTVAFLLVILSFGGCVATTAVISAHMRENGVIDASEYVKTDEVRYRVGNFLACAGNVLNMKNEEFIRSAEYRAVLEQEYHDKSDMETLVTDAVRDFHNAADFLADMPRLGFHYYVSSGDTVYSDYVITTPEEFKARKYYYLFTGKGAFETTFPNYAYHNVFPDHTAVYLACDDEYLAAKQAEYDIVYREQQRLCILLLILFILGLLALIYLMTVCGKNTSGERKMLTIDRLWCDISFALLLCITFGFFSHIVWFQPYNDVGYRSPAMMMSALLSSLLCAAGLTLLLSLVRHIKNHTLLRHSLIGTLCRHIAKVCRTVFRVTPLNIKIITGVLAAELITAVLILFAIGSGSGAFLCFLLAIAGTVAVLYYIIKHVIKPYDDEVTARLERSLEKELKAERFKTELITNVSHDLKTPLTAIINYADLLIKENADNEYARVIYEKSHKLKHLTEDLFEVSKAQSGNMPVTPETLDVSELIAQTMAEFDAGDIDFRIHADGVCITADGKLMSRVFENLISNIIKYAMPGTRAYIDAYQKDGKTYITFKNISGYELAGEMDMTERFVRADKARTTEGSGLGLAIAQSYTQACGGRLDVSVDGDLFKVQLIF